jgi:hypothetical protein
VCISIPDVDAYIMVLQAIEPQITLQGTERFWRPAAQFESARGVTLFPDIKIVSTFAKTEASGDMRATGTGTYRAIGRVDINPLQISKITLQDRHTAYPGQNDT